MGGSEIQGPRVASAAEGSLDDAGAQPLGSLQALLLRFKGKQLLTVHVCVE